MVRRLRSFGAVVALGAILSSLAGVSAAAAADGGTAVVTGRVSAGVVAPGSHIRFGGSGFAPRTPIRLTIEGTSVATTRADASGAFLASLLVDGSEGYRTLAGSGLGRTGGTRVATVTVRLVAADAAADPAPSGRSTTLALLVGFGLVVVFAAGRLLVRRQRVGAVS
jgi:hypothetical protein